jgi:CRP/FNR family transcriptional regulator
MAQTKVKPADFFNLGEAELKELKKHSSERKLAKGDYIWQAGDDPESVYIVQEGRANMVIEGSEGNSALVHFCTKAQTFCPAAAIAGKPYPCSAIAATEMTLVSVPRSKFMALFNRLPGFARQLLTQMAPQVCESHCLQAQSTAPVKARLATALSGLNERFKGDKIPFTRQELANMTGTTVETTIRTLSDWEREGVIHSERGNIQVRQLEALEEACA